MQGALSPATRRALGPALLLCALHAGALEFGEIEVRSALGEPLDARVPLTLSPGEYVEGGCFSMQREPASTAVPPLGAATLSVHSSPGGRKALRVRSGAPVQEPAFAFGIRASCRGQASEATRQFTVLLDPRPSERRATRAGAPAPRERIARAAPPPAALPSAPVRREPARAPAPRAASARGPAEFVLRLSSADVDLSRSRGIDDRARARLRERQLLLDADDHVAALLALRHSVRQLETKVAELQLKLTTLPESLQPRTAAAAAAKGEPGAAPRAPLSTPVRVEPAIAARGEAPAAAAPLADGPKVQRAPPEPPAPRPAEPAKPALPSPAVQAPAPPVAPAPAAPAPPAAGDAVKAKPATSAAPEANTNWLEGIPSPWLYAALAVVLVLLAALLAWLARRRREPGEAEPRQAPELARAQPAFDAQGALATGAVAAPERAMSSDAGLSTRLPENSRELRRRYIEERFPEIANRTLKLDDPSSVVKAARLYYSDGAFARAVELLQFCIEDNPGEVRFWLALFEIFRLERLAGEYAELATRFKSRHGTTDYWRKVQYFGREIDPANPLYKEDPVDTLQTIGPSEARRVARARAPIDPIAENWLEAPMDFENEVLANELRRKLMAQAGLTEQDLAPNTMPVLRNVEMFQVA